MYNKVVLDLGDYQKEVWRVDLCEADIVLARNLSSEMWVNTKKGEWGSGLINTKDDPYRAERIGRMGEIAFSKLTGLPVNISYIKGGDKCDFTLEDGRTVNIKTAAKLYEYRAGLIRATTSNLNRVVLHNDLYIFSYVDDVAVIIVGYQTRGNIELRQMSEAKKGSHLNYEIPYSELCSIDDLIEVNI